jgi:hypothetical protein
LRFAILEIPFGCAAPGETKRHTSTKSCDLDNAKNVNLSPTRLTL